MQQDRQTEVLIIGAGPAGLAAAIYTARANRRTIVLKGSRPTRLETAHLIENYPGFMSVTGSELLTRFEEQARHMGAEIVETDALDLGLGMDPKMVNTRNGIITADTVLLATGKGIAKPSVEGEEEYLGRGVSYCAVCDGAFYRGKKVVVYGSNDEALEDALLLKELGSTVQVVTDKPLQECAAGFEEKLSLVGIPIISEASVTEVRGSTAVQEILYRKKDGTNHTLSTDGLFIVSQVPAGLMFKRAGLELDSKNCLVVDRSQQTTIPGVFAAGDNTCGGMQIATAVGEGVRASLQILKYLREKKTEAGG